MPGWETGEAIGGPRLNAQGPWPLGGSPHEEIVSLAYVPVPGAIIVEIDGTDLDTPEVADVEVHVTSYVQPGGTGTYRLWNITTGAIVGGEHPFSNDTLNLIKSGVMSSVLATGPNRYRLEVKVAAATDRAVIHGAVLIVR